MEQSIVVIKQLDCSQPAVSYVRGHTFVALIMRSKKLTVEIDI